MRVDQWRKHMNVMAWRFTAAIGGVPTLYFTSFFVAGGATLAQVTAAETLPTAAVLSSAGAKAYLLRAGWVLGPAVFGLYAGIGIFGDREEVKKLLRFRSVYSAEFNNYQKELYYA